MIHRCVSSYIFSADFLLWKYLLPDLICKAALKMQEIVPQASSTDPWSVFSNGVQYLLSITACPLYMTAGDPREFQTPPQWCPEWFHFHSSGKQKQRYLSKPWKQFKMMCGVEIGIMISHCLASLLRGCSPDLKLNWKRKSVSESQVWRV